MGTLINEQFTILSTKHSKPILADIRFEEEAEPSPLIIFCHGFKGFKDWGHFNQVATTFASRGYVFLKFNFSHNGTTVEHPTEFKDLEAFGNNNISKELDDLDDIINAVINDNESLPEAPIDKEKIFLIGHSRGGGTAILKAAVDDRIKAVVGWAPVSNFKTRYEEKVLNQWKKDGVYHILNSRTGQNMPLYYQLVEDIFNNERTDIQRTLKNLKIPLLAIHGSSDETLDFEETLAIKSLNSLIEVEIIENANHTFGGSHPWTSKKLPEHTKQVIEFTDKFFRRMF